MIDGWLPSWLIPEPLFHAGDSPGPIPAQGTHRGKSSPSLASNILDTGRQPPVHLEWPGIPSRGQVRLTPVTTNRSNLNCEVFFLNAFRGSQPKALQMQQKGLAASG